MFTRTMNRLNENAAQLSFTRNLQGTSAHHHSLHHHHHHHHA